MDDIAPPGGRSELLGEVGAPVLTTKLHVPEPLSFRLTRPSLVDSVQAVRDARLVLVSAPAGSGKTTLLSSWHADPREARPFAWVSLDEGDNDPVRFWTYVLAALRTVVPGLAPEVTSALRTSGTDVCELALPLLVNAIAECDQELVLVLDDYHLIAAPEVHRSVEFLVDKLPTSLQLVIATRRDPPFALARLRARAELWEVRPDELALTTAEAGALLNQSLGLSLDDDQIASLNERTEGWAAGLQLVGLSLHGRDRDDQARYIDALSGDDRQIVDYLAAEVLDHQPPELRRFLLRTSILERLSGSLCDAVIGCEGSDRRLAEAERANLFLFALDDRRGWYRYHAMFRELLEHELSESDPGAVAELHRRARAWHDAHGLTADAIHHAIAAGDVADAAERIAANWLGYVNRGELATVETWTNALPRAVTDSDPRLGMARAWMLLVLGRPAEVEREVRAALAGTLPGPMRDGSRSLESSAAMVRTSARLLLGDVGGAARTAREAAELEPDPTAPWRPIVTNALGMTAYWSGELDAAVAAFEETVLAAEATGNHTAGIYALGHLAIIRAERADALGADELCDRAQAWAEHRGLGSHWVTVMARYARGEVLRINGDLAAASTAIHEGFRIATRGGLRLDTVYGLLASVRIDVAQGEYDSARRLYKRAELQLMACPDPAGLRTRLLRSAPPHPLALGPSQASADELSPREREVLRLLATELSTRQIGDELYVSFNTVRTHVRSVYAKLRVGSRADALARARELGLLQRRT